MNYYHPYFAGVLNAFAGKALETPTKIEAPTYPAFDNPQTGIRTVYVPCEWAPVQLARSGSWIDMMPSEAIIQAATRKVLDKYQSELEALVVAMMKGAKP